MKKESPLRSSISLLIGIVIAILALVRGRMLLPLLLAVFAVWLLWWLLGRLFRSGAITVPTAQKRLGSASRLRRQMAAVNWQTRCCAM